MADDERRTMTLLGTEHLGQKLFSFRVKVVGWLIEQYQVGEPSKNCPDGQELKLTSAQRIDPSL